MSRPPVVLYAAQSLPASPVACATRCHHLGEALRRAGFPLEIWSHTPGTATLVLRLPFPDNRWPTPVRMLVEAAMAVELVIRLALRRLRGRPPVVILSSPPYVTCFFVALACRALGIAYVFDARDVYPEVLFNLGVIRRDSFVGRRLAALTRGIYRHAAMVTTPSHRFAETIRAQVPDAGSVHVVRNGWDDAAAPSTPVARAGAPFTCVFHGLLGRMHDIALLLAVARRVAELRPEVRFLVAGYGPKEDQVRHHGLPNLEFRGKLAHGDVPALLREADLGLAFICENEGADGAFPVKVYEYLGAGLPVFVTPVSEAGRLIRDRAMGRAFAAVDAEAIATAIATAIAEAIATAADRGPEWQAGRDAVLAGRHEFGRRVGSDRFASALAAVVAASGAPVAATASS
ncbi:MAG: glycosyltransferase [Gemmatimonadota bacterium]